jgi:eukaryotic-like serine/threonine-protein kinase
MIESTVLHYKILEKLGEGGMGVVYKAHDTKLDRTVALKFLPQSVSPSEEDKTRFIQEAKAAATLNHPNICTIHDIQESDTAEASTDRYSGQLFIVMEYIEGQTLRDRAEKQKDAPISQKQAIDVGIQIAEGLAAAHENGIIHRDIKPENVMLKKDGRVVVMDFGLAKLRGVSRLTKEGSTVGTMGYMAPEQVQGLDVDHRADIFSLGVILYELFTYEAPFKGAHETAMAYEIVNVDPAPLTSLKPDIDPELERIVQECIDKDRDERYQSAREVAKDLKRFKRESGRQKVSRITASHPAYVPQSGQTEVHSPDHVETRQALPRAAHHDRRNIPFLSAAALLVLVSALFVFMQLTNKEPEVLRSSFHVYPLESWQYSTFGGGHLTVSPDGRITAYVAEGVDNVPHLWIRPLDDLSSRMLPGTEGAMFPFWSPDSRFIGFFADGKLKKIDITGGRPLTVCDAANGRGGSWNQHGDIIFASQPTSALYRVPDAGGIPEQLTSIDDEPSGVGHRWPAFLPDGKHFLYLWGNIDSRDLYVASLDLKVNKRILNNSSNVVYANGKIFYIRESMLMGQPFNEKKLELTGQPNLVAENILYNSGFAKGAFSFSQSGVLVYQAGQSVEGVFLNWYDEDGTLTHTLATGRYIDVHLSPDGNQLAVDFTAPETQNRDIWIYDLEREFKTRFTHSSGIDRMPRWSPDGKRIAFSSNRNGTFDLFIKESGGAAEEELLFAHESDMYISDWSRDGKYILINALDQLTSRWSIWVVPLEDASEAFQFLATEFNEFSARFSPDSKWVVYGSDISGRNEIYMRSFPVPGAVRQISTSGGVDPVWSRDGSEIYFIDPANNLKAARIRTIENRVEVESVRDLFTTNKANWFSNALYDVSPDGKRFLIVSTGSQSESPPITFVVNWDSELPY